MSRRIKPRGHQPVSLSSGKSQLINIWVWPIAGHLQWKKHRLRDALQGNMLSWRVEVTWAFREANLLPDADLPLTRKDMVEPRDRRASRVGVRSHDHLATPAPLPNPRQATCQFFSV